MKCKVFIWAVLYSAIYLAVQYIGSRFLSALFMFLYIVLFVGWIYKKGLHTWICISLKDIKRDKSVHIILLFVLPVYNLMFFDNQVFIEYNILMMLVAAIAEEIFFRGFIQHGLNPKGLLVSMILTNILFALYHVSNVIAGVAIEYVGIQMIFAFVVGMAYSLTVAEHKSIVPCIAAHFMTNITGEPGVFQGYVTNKPMILILVVYLIYDVYLIISNACMCTIINKKQGEV